MNDQASPLNIDPQALKLGYMIDKYQMTPKQAKYALAVIERPEATREEQAREAGYSELTHKSNGGRVLKSSTIMQAVKEEREAIERKSSALVKALASDARGAIAGVLSEHAYSPDITPNQTRAVELLGKMSGVFVDRIELDAGEHTRARFAADMMENSSQPSGETET